MTDSDGDSSLDLSGAATSSGSESSNSGGDSRSGGGGVREPVVVKGEYGTTFFPAHTECDECNRNAEGVLVIRSGSDDGDRRITDKEVYCRTHREKLEKNQDIDVDNWDYRQFNP